MVRNRVRKGLVFVIVLILIAVVFTAVPTNVSATLHVGPGQTYDTIQSAINAASAGDTVYVHAATYNENVVVNKKIKLIGEGKDKVFIDGGGIRDVVKITKDGVIVNSLSIRDSGPNWFDAGIEINSSNNCVIKDCMSYSNSRGILLDLSSSNNSIAKNQVKQNTVGIWLDRSSNYNTITNNNVLDNNEGIVIDISNYNIVSNNTVANNKHHGINVHEFSCTNTISYNSVSQSKIGIIVFWLACHTKIITNQIYDNDYGIILDNSSHNTIYQNTVYRNVKNGITLEDSDWNTVDDNKIMNNDIGLKLTNANYNTIQNNWYSGNNVAINVDPSYNNLIRRNVIIKNQLGLAVDQGSTGNIIYHNDFVNNDGMVCCYPTCSCGAPKNSFHSPDMLEGNYWSDYSGKDDGSGKGLYGEPREKGDGVGDTETPHLGYDWYPLMSSRSLTGPIDNYIQDLPDNVFKNKPDQQKNALQNKLEVIQGLVEKENYQGAINKLTNDIRCKMDGNPKNDWITDPTTQRELCAMIDELIGNLEMME